MQEPRDVAIYTRGIGLPGIGAFGALLVCDGRERELFGTEAKASNNRMDLLAAVEGLAALKWPCRVKLYNSNGYLIDGMAKGPAERWQENRWQTNSGQPTAHSDLWEKLLALCAEHTVEFVWVPTSEKCPEFWRCEQLARELAVRQSRERYELSSAHLKRVGVPAPIESAFIPPPNTNDEDTGASEPTNVPVRACVGCGQPIAPERLEMIPDATRCVSCQQRSETTQTEPHVSEVECPRCAAQGVRSRMVWRTARDPTQFAGYFLGCSRIPRMPVH